MAKFQIYLKGGAIIEVEAQRIEFPDHQSELLQIYVSDNETDKHNLILVSEVAAVRLPKKSPLAGIDLIQSKARRRE